MLFAKQNLLSIKSFECVYHMCYCNYNQVNVPDLRPLELIGRRSSYSLCRTKKRSVHMKASYSAFNIFSSFFASFLQGKVFTWQINIHLRPERGFVVLCLEITKTSYKFTEGGKGFFREP